MRNYTVPPIPKSIWTNPIHFIAFGFGSGALPIAPGTFGTLAAIPFYLLFSNLTITYYFVFLIIATLASIWICEKVSQDTKTHDHQGMCIDEFVGFFVAMTGLPATFAWISAAFILFRIFDIWKPWPINWMDKNITGGTGMILDDVMAGIYTTIILNITWIFFR